MATVSTPSLRPSIAFIVTHADYLHQHADYPAIISSERGKALLGREITSEENSVRGTLVSGLTGKDLAFLDCFEASEGTVCVSNFRSVTPAYYSGTAIRSLRRARSSS